MVIGHNTLMKVLDHMGERGVKTSRFLFHPTDKVFALEVMPAVKHNGQFVRLSMCTSNMAMWSTSWLKVEGNTPLLIGRQFYQLCK